MEKLNHKFGNDGVSLAPRRMFTFADSETAVLLDIVR